jgi:hypothetical protein
VWLSELRAWVKASAAAGAIACHRAVDAGDGPPRGGRELRPVERRRATHRRRRRAG